MDMEEIHKRILDNDCRHLVVTGGEPMLQQDDLVPLLRRLKEERFTTEIETNGTILPNQKILGPIDQWNVSPKISNSGNSVSLREKPECYQFFRSLPNSNFKFVVENKDDLGEILELVRKYDIPRDKVILMPESTSPESLREKSSWLAEICRNEGFRFSTRLHILLYGNRRGV